MSLMPEGATIDADSMTQYIEENINKSFHGLQHRKVSPKLPSQCTMLIARPHYSVVSLQLSTNHPIPQACKPL